MTENAYRPPTWSMMPPVIKNLLIINALVFFAQYVFSGATANPVFGPIEQWFALWPIAGPDIVRTPYGDLPWPQFWPWQIVTMAFLHGGIGHILMNMFILWMFGMRIENVWGSRRFLTYYFACVIGASLAQLAIVYLTDGLYPTLGASGGVLGVLLAFGMMYPEEPIYLYFLFPIKAKWLVVGLAALDLYAGVTGTQAGVANFAHLGGMLTGFLMIQYWRGRLPLGPRRERPVY